MDVIAQEAEGGDLNVVLNQCLDTTSVKRNKLSKLVNTADTDDIGFWDIWRYVNPFDTNYSLLSSTLYLLRDRLFFYAKK